MFSVDADAEHDIGDRVVDEHDFSCLFMSPSNGWRLEAPLDADIAMEISALFAEHPQIVDTWFDGQVQVFASGDNPPLHPKVRPAKCACLEGCDRCQGSGWYLKWIPITPEDFAEIVRLVSPSTN